MKHPNVQFRKLVKEIRDPKKKKKLYQPREIRKINWEKYTLSKINEYKTSLDFIRNSVNELDFIDAGNGGRPSTNLRYLVKAILVCELFGCPERQAQGLLEIIGPYLGIHDSVDDRVIGKAYDNPKVAMLLRKIFEKYKDSDGILGGDGTGLERSRKENYESTKKKKAGQYMTSVVDSREIVQAFDISGTQECQIMFSLIKNIKGKSLALDAGFNCRDLVKKISRQGMKPIIFPKKNNNLNGDPFWQKMYYDFYNDVVGWLIEYHQRSHTESFYSSFKRTFGIVTKLKLNAKFVQICARIILHNHKRLSYFNLVGK
jgi:transposase